MAAEDQSTRPAEPDAPNPRPPFPDLEHGPIRTRRSARPRSALRRSSLLSLVLAAGLLAVGITAATVVVTDPSQPPALPSGQIVAPASGTTVPATTVARGTLSRIPEGEYVWLVARDGSKLVRRGAQLPVRDRETYTWRTRLKLGGTRGAVSIELYRMGDEGHRLLRDRLTRGSPERVGTIPDAKRLDMARNVRIRR